MAVSIQLEAASRAGTPQQIRAKGAIPGILYGHGVKNEVVQIDSKAFRTAFAKSGYTTLVNLQVKGKTHTVLIREVQHHPLRDEIDHVDFYQVRLDEKVRAEVPLNFVGESIAVKDLNGVLVRNMDTLDLEALPQDLPHDIEVDIAALKDFEAVIHVSDLKIPAGITLFHEPEDVVAVVQAPRSEQELEALSEEATEDVEAVETIGKEKADEEEPAEGVEAPTPEAEPKE
jgi:large subunit ribosomal protein L25